MLLLANSLLGLAEVLYWVLWTYQWILVGRMIISSPFATPSRQLRLCEAILQSEHDGKMTASKKRH